MFTATAKAVAEREKAAAWTQTDELLATLTEIVHALYVVTVQAHSSKRVSIHPLHIPRPGDQPQQGSDLPDIGHSGMFALGR